MSISFLVEKALNDETLSPEEIAELFEVPLFTADSGLIIAAGRQKSIDASNGLAEVHGQVGLNIAPCPKNCLFCAFAAENRVFKKQVDFPLEEVIAAARQFEEDGANAVVFMITAQYSFEKFFEITSQVRSALKPETPMIANVGDFSADQAKNLKEIGFSGIYHAVRLGEGQDTDLDPRQRLKTIENAKESGLIVGTCVEPVGPEHSIEELVEKTIITRDIEPCFSGSARRIPIPGTEMASRGQTTEARMAHILAVVRLALPMSVPGNCTHEPNVYGCAAGANQLWAEAGSNPRDTKEETKDQRGMTVEDCRKILRDAQWDILTGPSRFYASETIDQPIQT